LISWAVMFARVLFLVTVVNRDLLPAVFVPFSVMTAVVVAIVALTYYRSGIAEKQATAKGKLNIVNPFSLTEAAKFAALFAAVLLAVKIVQENFPLDGVYAVAALAGLTDVDAITLSMADFAKSGEAQVAVVAIVIAALVNTFVKCGIAFAVAGWQLAKPLLITTSVVLIAGLAAAVLA